MPKRQAVGSAQGPDRVTGLERSGAGALESGIHQPGMGQKNTAYEGIALVECVAPLQ